MLGVHFYQNETIIIMGKQKILIILGVSVLVVFIGTNLWLHSTFRLTVFDVLSTWPLSDQEIENRKWNMERIYPDTIKGNLDPASIYLSKLVRESLPELKELGVNTIFVNPEYSFNPDGTLNMLTSEDKQVISNIIRIKDAGFAVIISTISADPDKIIFEERGIPMTLEKYLQASEEFALKWAKISEDYAVEYFAPQNEFDIQLEQFTLNDEGDPDEDEMSRIASEWHKQLAPKIRDVYSGKIIAKFGDTRETDDLTGYDYIGVTIDPVNDEGVTMNLDNFREYMRYYYSTLAGVAERSNASWLISEAWMPYAALFDDTADIVNEDGESLDGLQDDYYRIAGEVYMEFMETDNPPSGFVFISWLIPGEEIRNRPAEKVIKDFFSRI
jgi:hypothetical protein